MAEATARSLDRLDDCFVPDQSLVRSFSRIGRSPRLAFPLCALLISASSIAYGPLALATATPAVAQGSAYRGPGYQIIRNEPNVLEIRFHGVGIRGIQADDSQNALAIDFQQPIDAAMFGRLTADAPLWISMSYSNFDNGVIRGTRPVTFLTRAEADGFSLRMVPRPGAPPMQSPTTQGPVAQAAPPPTLPPPPPMRGGYTEQRVWPPPEPVPPATAAGFHTPGEYAALRAYEAQELAIRRGDPMWQLAYGRAAMASDSGLGFRNETSMYHSRDRMIATDLDGKLSFAPGIALVADAKWTSIIHGAATTLPAGSFVNTDDNLVTGAAGLAFELGLDSELKLQALGGNDLIGAGMKLYSGTPAGFFYLDVNYHQPYLDNPIAVAVRADTDNATIGYTQLLAPGLWGSLAGHFTRYGVHGSADIGRTAGWDGSLRWNIPVWDGLLAGISYDGHGEYLTDNSAVGALPTPLGPPALRNIENHAVAANLSGFLGDAFWFAAYVGWVGDRYASNGLLAGLDLHYIPRPGLDLALGVRQSHVSYTQGERGDQLTAGLNLTVGMGAPPQPSWMLNGL
jgi:hypothetical protein